MKGFVVDTNEYSGDFEREMCAYMTGVTNGTMAGMNFMNTYPKVSGVVTVLNKEYDIYNPCDIYPTPNYFNNGYGYHYRADDKNALKNWKQDCNEELQKEISKAESYRGKNDPHWTDEIILDTINENQLEIEEINEFTKLEKFDAYQSVIIYFDDNSLQDELIETLKSRAYEFAAIQKIKIENFRIINLEEI